jgi:ATP-dependent DNA helicase DinG
VLERRAPATLGLAPGALDAWLDAVGPVACLALETTGPPERRSAAILEIGILLLDPQSSDVGFAHVRMGPTGATSGSPARRAGTASVDGTTAPLPAALGEGLRGTLGEGLRATLAGRLLVAHDAEIVRRFLVRDLASDLAAARWLDLRDLLAVVHPDAPDLRIETFAHGQPVAGPPARPRHGAEGGRALDAAFDLARVLARAAEGARAGEARYGAARRILERHRGETAWSALLGPAPDPDAPGGGPAAFARRASAPQDEEAEEGDGFLRIGASDETPVPFERDAILEALADADRGARHFPGYRVREEQLELAGEFVTLLDGGGVARLEGGTGVGKSLAYLAAAIPFAIEREAAGVRQPVVLSTRTKLLQDQLLQKDIAAAARFLGHPELRALSIKGRANYVCERRLSAVLGESRDPALLDDLRADYAVLEACARIRPHGEVGTVPADLMRRYPRLRELLRDSVAARAEQCSREQCAHERRCPFGRLRKRLGRAHLLVANHDLLLRWPPDYPAFAQVVMDEGHEIGGVAEEVYSLRVRPEDVAERLEELFGRPAARGRRRYATRGLVAPPPTRSEEDALRRNRRELMLELAGLGRAVAVRADAFGGAELPPDAGTRLGAAAEIADGAAARLEALARHAERAGAATRTRDRRGAEPDGLGAGARAGDVERARAAPSAGGRGVANETDDEAEAERAITTHVEALLGAAHALRIAFSAAGEEMRENADYVAAFEGLEPPWDRWSLVLRPVSPGEALREQFLGRLESLAVVSATLFVGGDDHAALGEAGLGEAELPESWSRSVGSPFPYDRAMRVVAIDAEDVGDLVEETAQTLAVLARTLGGRTLGLFTSLARMRETADRLAGLLAGEGIEVLLPRSGADDPGALVDRFQKAPGGAVLLGARRYWQGIDVRGDLLQAVVIEKLPFDVPTELRRRRDGRLREAGEDPFVRASLGRMLLHLKQMSGRLIRSESDRGLVVIVDARRDRGYFRRLGDALPPGAKIEIAPREDLPRIAAELGLGLDPELGPLAP